MSTWITQGFDWSPAHTELIKAHCRACFPTILLWKGDNFHFLWLVLTAEIVVLWNGLWIFDMFCLTVSMWALLFLSDFTYVHQRRFWKWKLGAKALLYIRALQIKTWISVLWRRSDRLQATLEWVIHVNPQLIYIYKYRRCINKYIISTLPSTGEQNTEI